MSADQVGAGVVRGMQLEAAPLRLRRAGGAPAAAPQRRAPEIAVREEGLRLGLEQGLREGRQQGLQAGHEEGLRAGRAQAQAELRNAVEHAVAEALLPLEEERRRLQQIGNALAATTDSTLAAAHDEMVALCYETICRMLGATAVQPEAVRQQLVHLRALGRGKALVMHVHPQDAVLLETVLQGMDPSLRWAADAEVVLGGCILRGAHGGLDARLETMLGACRDALLEGRARSAGGAAEVRA